MKKTYIQPSMKAYSVHVQNVLTVVSTLNVLSSGDGSDALSKRRGDDDDAEWDDWD